LQPALLQRLLGPLARDEVQLHQHVDLFLAGGCGIPQSLRRQGVG
jgi:hypothetical protein